MSVLAGSVKKYQNQWSNLKTDSERVNCVMKIISDNHYLTIIRTRYTDGIEKVKEFILDHKGRRSLLAACRKEPLIANLNYGIYEILEDVEAIVDVMLYG